MVHLIFGTMRDHSSSSSPSFSHSSSSSPSSTPSLSPLQNAAMVPFLWEKKAGVSKDHKEITKKMQPLLLNTDFVGKLKALKVSSDTEHSVYRNRRPLPRPPCLQQPSQAPCCQRRNVLSLNSRKHIGTFSESFIARRHRKLRAKDDPFLLAIEVCKKEVNDSSDSPNLTSKVVAKLRRKKKGYNPLLIQDKKAIRNTARTYSFKSLSFESEEKNVSTETQKNSEASWMNGNSVNISERENQKKSTANDSSKTRRLRSSRGGRDESPHLRKNVPIQAPKELLYRLHSQVPAEPRSGSMRKQCHRVQLSCGQHRKINFHAFKGKKQAFQAWFGCRSRQSFNSAVTNPSTKSLRIVP